MANAGNQNEITTKTIVGIVLAGGGSSRLGFPKHTAVIGNRSLLRHVGQRLAVQVNDVAINLKASAEDTEYTVLVDPYPGEGPLAGVLRGLEWAVGVGADYLITMPVDVPFFPKDFTQVMLSSSDTSQPNFAVAGGRVHGLCALWPVTVLPVFKSKFHGEGVRTVNQMHDLLGSKGTVFPHDEHNQFININTPDDLIAANDLLSQMK